MFISFEEIIKCLFIKISDNRNFTSRLLRNYIINLENVKGCDMHQYTFLDLQESSINLSASRFIKSYLSALLCTPYEMNMTRNIQQTSIIKLIP
jgi:hypothetical protein